MIRFTFNNLIYFSLLNFLAYKKENISNLSKQYPITDKDIKLYRLFKKFVKIKRVNSNIYENKCIAGVSYFENIFEEPDNYVPFGTKANSKKYEDSFALLTKTIKDRIKDIEGGYILGGYLGDKISPMIFPQTFHKATNEMRLYPKQIYNIFFPKTFSDLYGKRKIIGNSRTCNTLGAVLLHKNTITEPSRVFVLKETPYGELGWSKAYYVKVEDNNFDTYQYIECDFLTEKELKYLINLYNIEFDYSPNKDFYICTRKYKLNRAIGKFEKSQLALTGITLIDPKSLFV